MTEYSVDKVRAQFEAAMRKTGYLFTWNDEEGDYEESSMTFAWIGYQAAYANLLERIAADEGVVPVLHIRCEVQTESSIAGSTYLNVVRVEQEDDGSFTAVTDHWPNPPAQAAQVDALNGEMLQAGADALEKYVAWEATNDEERYACVESVWRAMQGSAPPAKSVAQGEENDLRKLAELYGEHAWNDGVEYQKKHGDNPTPPPDYPDARTTAALEKLLAAAQPAERVVEEWTGEVEIASADGMWLVSTPNCPFVTGQRVTITAAQQADR